MLAASVISFSQELSAEGDREASSSTSFDSVLEGLRREAPDLAEIVEKVREPLPKVGDRTPVHLLRSSASKGGSTGRRRSAVVARSSVKKETLHCPPCDATNPIVISDGEEEEKEAEKAGGIDSSKEGRASRQSSSRGGSPPPLNGSRSSSSNASVEEVSASSKEISSTVSSSRVSESAAGPSLAFSREDLYYDDADRAELSTWAEFPREAELTRRYELVVRSRQREELLGNAESPQNTPEAKRKRLARRVGRFSSGSDVEKNRSVTAGESPIGKRGRIRVLASSGDDGEEDEVSVRRSEADSPKPLSSRDLLGKRGRLADFSSNMAPKKRRSKFVSEVGDDESQLGEEEQGAVTLTTGESVLPGISRSSRARGRGGEDNLHLLSQRQADLLEELANVQREHEEEEKRIKEREEARREAEEERVRRRREEREKRETERQQRAREAEEEENRRRPSNGVSSELLRGRGRLSGVAAAAQLAVSIRPLRPSAAIVSIAARRGVLSSAWLPIKGAIRPTVGDEVVLGRGRTATEAAIQPMHMEFFLPR